MLYFALTVTALIGILVIIVALGLVGQKVSYGIRAARSAKLDELYQQKMDPILLEDLPADSLDPNSLPFRQAVKRFCEPLRSELAKVSWFSRRAHRSALKRVMLGMSRELVGETLARLTLAFQVLGFVEDELKDLRDRRWWVRAKACRNLAQMHAGDATADLVILLSDKEEDVRIEASLALVNISGVRALNPLFRNIRNISVWMSISLSKVVLSMGSAAVPELIDALSSFSPSVKSFCTEMLGEIGDISACVPLIELARTAEVPLRRKALVAIGKLGDEAGKQILVEHLSHEDESLRIRAAEGLGYLAAPDTAPFLKEHLLHDAIHVRLAAGNSLKRIDTGGRDFFIDAYRQADDIGKKIVLQFLEELGVPEEAIGRIGQ